MVALMALHALELVLDDASDALIRAEWEALARAGLPSQARHTGLTNAPHVTVVAAPENPADVEAFAVERLGPLLPLPVELAGIVLLGRGPYAFARLLEPNAALGDAVRAIRGRVPHPHSPGWTAHLTLARRLCPEQVGPAIAAVATGAAAPRHVVVAGLRRWDPDAGERGAVRLLAGAAAPEAKRPDCER